MKILTIKFLSSNHFRCLWSPYDLLKKKSIIFKTLFILFTRCFFVLILLRRALLFSTILYFVYIFWHDLWRERKQQRISSSWEIFSFFDWSEGARKVVLSGFGWSAMSIWKERRMKKSRELKSTGRLNSVLFWTRTVYVGYNLIILLRRINNCCSPK